MLIIPQRTKKIVNEIDYETDYSDSYNMLIQWKSIKRPITGTWKLFAENQFFKQLKEHSEKYHQSDFDNAIMTIGAKRALALSLIIKSDSYIDGLIDCLDLISEQIRSKSKKLIEIYIIDRDVERYEYRQAYLEDYY